VTVVLVAGALANKPFQGGEAWVRLSWALGLRRLGFDVVFVEQIDPDACVDGAGRRTTFEESVNLEFFKAVTAAFGLDRRAALVHGAGDRVHGMSLEDVEAAATEAEALVNISGHLTLPSLFPRLRTRVYVDLDPGFTQFWHAQGNPGARLEGHRHFFTVGTNIGSPDCHVPTGGIPWRPIAPPVILDQWGFGPADDPGRFTTIASWRGPYGPIEHGGRTYGLKVHEFRKLATLPSRVDTTFELALEIDPSEERDLAMLREEGWRLVDPGAVASTPEAFRRYVRSSGAEFSVAKGVYVDTGNGWFSDRTANYLASGRPAVVQDTGFGRTYPTGEGVLTFRTLDEAVTAVESVLHDHQAHGKAARALAEEHFDSDRVLAGFVEQVGLSP
jgi:hypothetical protein